MDTTINTYNKIARKYSDRFFDKNMSRQHNDFIKYAKKELLLDAGSGPGRDTKYFLGKGFKVIGIDLSPGMLKEARRKVPGGRFIKMDIRKLKFKNKIFDGIWCQATLLHLPKNQAELALKEYWRVLKKEAILFISVKKGKGEGMTRYKGKMDRFFAYYSKDEISKLIERNHFKILKSYIIEDTDGDIFINLFCRKQQIQIKNKS